MRQFQEPSKQRIDGVVVKNLKVMADNRGRLMEIMRADDLFFEKFGQAYLTTAYPGVVKAFHYHKTQTDIWAVVHGMIQLVLHDSRDGSPTKNLINVFYMGEHNPILVKIPPMVTHGFKTIGEKEALIINLPTEMYDYKNPDEYRLEPHGEIPFDWNKIDG